MTRFGFEPIYGSVILVILAVVATVGVIAWVTPATEDWSKRRWLIGLRSIAGLVLLLAALRPALVRTDNRPSPASLVVAVDASRSMTLPDGDGEDRWTTQLNVVRSLGNGIESLADSLDVVVLRYDAATERIFEAVKSSEISQLSSAIDRQEPDGDATDLGQALRDAIDAAAGNPLAGVVLIGDGTQTSPAENSPAGKPSQPAEEAAAARRSAEVLDSLGVPLWTVPIGPPGGDDFARDVAIAGLPDSFRLFAGNQFEASFSLEANGLAGERVPVTLTWLSADGEREIARTRQIDVRSARETTGMTLSLNAPDPGLYRLQVEAPTQQGEWVTSNNSQTAFVEVRSGGGRILILEGPGRPEQTFLRRALGRFPDLQLDYVSIRGEQTWPVALDSALQPGRYDIFVIGDLDASAIGDRQLSEIASRVSEGAGLLTLGGYQTYGTGGYAEGPLEKVLPVQMDAGRRRPPTRGVISPAERSARAAAQLQGPIQATIARDHPIVNLGGSDPETVWESLPELPGANRFAGVKVAAGVQVLLKTADDEPLLVVGGFGSGRVAAMALDETYRWWRAGKAEAHRRFWRQLMLWLMSREESGDNRVIVELDQRRFESDAGPAFSGRVQRFATEDPGDSNADLSLAARVVAASGEEIPVEATRTADEQPEIRGNLPKLSPGFYKLVVSTDAEAIEAGEIAFQVTETSRELARPMADPVYMQQLAELTAAHGGAAFDPTDIDGLVERIKQKRRSAETPVVETYRLGDGPVSGWIVFLCFAAAMTVEWALRRRWGLV